MHIHCTASNAVLAINLIACLFTGFTLKLLQLKNNNMVKEQYYESIE